MTKPSLYTYTFVSSNNDFHSTESLNLYLGRFKCPWGEFTCSLRPSAIGKVDAQRSLEVCLAIVDETPPKRTAFAPLGPSPTSVTFQLDTTVYTDELYFKRGTSHAGSTQLDLGPQTEPIAAWRTNAVVCSSLLIHYSEPKVQVHQLTVTLHAPGDPAVQLDRAFPSAKSLLDTLHAPHLCDCTLVLGDGLTLDASKAVLAHAAPAFFNTLFQRSEWTLRDMSPDQPALTRIPLDAWTVKTCLPCVLHMYTGWVPAHGPIVLPETVKASVGACNVSGYSLTDWTLVLELAQMLELPALVAGVKKAMVALIEK